MGWLDGQVCVVTGGGSGLGWALVERFLDEGAKIGVLEQNDSHARALQVEFGEEVEVVVGDVRKYRDNVSIVEQCIDKFGRVDTFICNAGIFDFFKALVDHSPDELEQGFDELFSVNLKGPLLGAHAALPALLKSHGNLIFTISNAGFYPGGGGPLYTASKHALVGLVRQLAYELAPKVRVNGVAPGGMRTNLSGLSATGTNEQKLNEMENFNELLKEITPLRIAPQPKDYCGPYVMLASDRDASPITGVVINTDGGFGARGIMDVRGGDGL